MNILVRLPNWLGDLVMAVGMIREINLQFPDAQIDVIVKKGLEDLLDFFPAVNHKYVFSKNEYKGWRGLWQFGRNISNHKHYDLFFCLPDSFSSAFMGFATNAKQRVGFKNELRSWLLTKAYDKPRRLHRAETYLSLLENYLNKPLNEPVVQLIHQYPRQEYIVVNINSEASSRRLTVAKAVDLLTRLRSETSRQLVLTGSQKEKTFVDEVLSKLGNRKGIENVAGTTGLKQLCGLLASAALMLSTDSGPAHLANALGTKTIVLFGAGNEAHTAPYNSNGLRIIRLGALSCEPCEKNVCVRYGIPQCLERLDTSLIVSTALQQL